jgi:transcriptional regulator with XRE-family HTH domain
MTADNLDEVEAISDPAARARRATELLNSHQGIVARLARIRRQAIAELRAAGLSYAQVADALGVSRGRIAQLRTQRAIEQEFFGGPAVTIITPLRTAGIERPVIAHEDFEAAMTLGRFLEAADIQVSHGQVAPNGDLDLSPDGLVAICGPKSSKVMEAIIATDPLYRYAPDPSGRWRILDRASGQEFRSPLDTDPTAETDIAYLARLPRPDDQRSFLVIAGVHAIGSLGAVQYLTQPAALAELHHTVGTKPFSMVLSSSFTRSPLRILNSEPLAPPRLHPS